MDAYLNQNRKHWNELVSIHTWSKFYDVDGFKACRSTLKDIELKETGLKATYRL